MSTVKHQFRLAARPVGLPKRSDWSLTDEPAPEPGDGEFLVKILYVSLDPAMQGWMNEGRSYMAPVGIGEVMLSVEFQLLAKDVRSPLSKRRCTARATPIQAGALGCFVPELMWLRN